MDSYVMYCDTDSHFINFDLMIEKQGIKKEWDLLNDSDKIEIIKTFSNTITPMLNNWTYKEVQLNSFNSIENEFKIIYKPEKISKSSLFIKKKKYANLMLWEEGMYGEKISVKGLEIVRSDTPTFFRKSLKEILELILKRESDDLLKQKVKQSEKKAMNLPIEEISGNIGVNNIKKYVTNDFKSIKGAPYHLKGTANYLYITNKLGIFNNYPLIEEGVKARVVYLKENQYGLGVLTYQEWPKEIELVGIYPDRKKMIDKFFLKKVEYLLSPMGKQNIINGNDNFSLFF